MIKKNITLTSEEVNELICALKDKMMNTEAAFKVNGIQMSEQTKRRLDAMDLLVKKLFCAKPIYD